MIDIKSKNGDVRYSVEITDKCVYHKELMTEEYVLLSFESDSLIPFVKGDYIDTEFGTFKIVTLDKPARGKNGSYSYAQKFHPDWEKFKTRIMFYDRQLGYEKAWKMTNTPEYFLDILVGNIYDEGFGRYSFEVDANLTEMKLVEFDGTSLLDALTKIAEAWETEWWITDKVIHLGRCEFGSAVSLSIGEEVTDMERSDGQDTEYITRLYAFGSTRNLRKNYRKNDDGDVVVEGVVETRLKLPVGIPYVDAWANMADEDVVEGVAIFDEVYPHRIGTISTITTKQYTDTIENENGTQTQEVWNAFRFTDSGITFSKEYVIEGEELRIIFQSGKLAGMDFAVTFNPDALSETDKNCQVFEIVRNEDYGVALPTDDFKPSVGDTYVLYGYDTKFIADKLESQAEDELYTKAIAKVAKTSEDKSVYDCPTNPIRCAGYKENSVGKMVYNSSDIIDLDVGQCVTLRSRDHFSTGYRTSRVRAFEKKLANKFVCTYTVGESSAYSKREELNKQVEDLTYQSKQFSNTYGSSVYVVKRYDKTAPTDHNVFSSVRSRYEFLQKNVPDRANKKIIFGEGLELGDYLQNEFGGRLDEKGNAELLSIVVRQLLRSAKFVNGFNGEGFQLWVDAKGISNLELDRLTVRQIMTVFELIISRIRAVGGQVIVSAANGKIKTVEDTGEAYRITFEGDNYFISNDLMRCQVFNGVTEEGMQNPVRGYWVEVLAVDGNGILVKKSEFDEYGTEPIAGDECVLMGNTEDEMRQNFISISATEDGQPRIDIMDGVKGKSFADCLRARFGNLDGISDNWFPADNQPHGNGLYTDNAYLRGTFLLSTGEDVKTKFEVIEGKIIQSVEGVRQDFMQEKGFLANPTFDGLNHWDTQNETVFFLVGNKWVWANKNVLTKQGDGASVIIDDGRRVVRVRNKYIKQSFANLRSVPEIRTNMDGLKEPAAIYLSFFYKVRKAGTLTIGFENVDDTGFVEYEHFAVNEEMGVTDTYQQFTTSGLWNSTGDFKLSFTGEMCLYMLVLSTDRIETLIHTYKTLFEQSEKLVKIAAMNFDKDGNVLESSSIITTAKFNELISARFNEDGSLKNTTGIITTTDLEAMKADGTIISSQAVQNLLKGLSDDVVHIEAFSSMFAAAVDADGDIVKQADISVFIKKDKDGNLESGVKVRGDQISLEGLTTINNSFEVKTDGTTRIGGFVVSGNGLTNRSEDGTFSDDAYVIFRNDEHGCFAGIGGNILPASTGIRGVARFENHDTEDFWYMGANYAMLVSAQGGRENVAIQMNGGSVACLALKTQVIGHDNIVQSTAPTSKSVTLDRNVGSLYVSTHFNWKASSSEASYTSKTRNIYLTLPTMDVYDDGHIIKIKRGSNDGSWVYVSPGSSYRMEYNSLTGKYDRTFGTSYILYDKASYATPSNRLGIESEGDSMTFVYHRDLQITIDGNKYYGCWIQYKHPRNW